MPKHFWARLSVVEMVPERHQVKLRSLLPSSWVSGISSMAQVCSCEDQRVNMIAKPFATFATAVILAGGASLSSSAYARGGHGGNHHRGPSAPTYLVVDIDEAIHGDDLENTLQKMRSTLAPFNGRVIIDSSSATSLDGSVPAKFLVIQFDNLEKAKEWNASNDGKEFEVVRHRATKSREFIVVGQPIEASLGGRSLSARQEMMKIRDEEINSLNGICKGC